MPPRLDMPVFTCLDCKNETGMRGVQILNDYSTLAEFGEQNVTIHPTDWNSEFQNIVTAIRSVHPCNGRVLKDGVLKDGVANFVRTIWKL